MVDIRGDLALLKWMIATLLSLQIALGISNLWLLMSILGRLPR